MNVKSLGAFLALQLCSQSYEHFKLLDNDITES